MTIVELVGDRVWWPSTATGGGHALHEDLGRRDERCCRGGVRLGLRACDGGRFGRHRVAARREGKRARNKDRTEHEPHAMGPIG